VPLSQQSTASYNTTKSESSQGQRQCQRTFETSRDVRLQKQEALLFNAPFKVKLPGFGYTVIARATGVECVADLKHESAIYRRLLPIQRKYVPVHLGEIEVDNLFNCPYDALELWQVSNKITHPSGT
jgi:hypothetical protein